MSVFRLDGGDLLDYLSVTYFVFRIGSGSGVGVTQETGVGVRIGVRTAPPRFRTPGDGSGARHKTSLVNGYGGEKSLFRIKKGSAQRTAKRDRSSRGLTALTT